MMVTRTVGHNFANSFATLPATQTRGGILLATDESFFDLSNIHLSSHAVTATISMRADAIQWQITVVYGPQSDDDKMQFLQELKNINPPSHGRWLILGDFNLIYQAEDKNNSNLNRRLMTSFKSTIDDLGLTEIKLNGRRFTWSNEQQNPTMTRIDRLLCTPEWELLFPACFLHSLPSLMSDHTPLLLLGDLEHFHNPFFRFENFWTKMDGFFQAVQEAWDRPLSTTLPIKRLHIKLSRVAKNLKKWKRGKIGNTRLQLAIAKEIILQLELAQESRTLTAEELDLRRRLKIRSTGLAVIEKSRMRQRSRLTYIHCGDANTKLFHLKANAHRRKNYIQCLQSQDGIVFSQHEKEKMADDYFSEHLGTAATRTMTIDWQALGYETRDLQHLELPFSYDEIRRTVFSMPSDKAPGPDGYTSAFFKACWDTIGNDLTAALNCLYQLNSQGFELLNSANIVLLPKKAEALRITDYRPISLIHSIAKIFAKLLANRLAPT
jgi:endonuclease/exonuclease/phosphatase family metal-dependent hydrolase